jgi:hypothetical protein
VKEVASFNVFHEEKDPSVILEDIVQVHDEGMFTSVEDFLFYISLLYLFLID